MLFYYSKDGKVFHSRYEALLYPEPCWLYFYDKEFLQVDWKTEPTTSLSDLYRARAEQIRSSFDYIILAYSGGCDSANILETFYYNNIPLDEIITVGALSQDSHSGSDENHNGDLYHNVFPTIKKLGLESKLKVFDYSTYFDKPQQFSLIDNYGSDWYKHSGSYYSPHHLFWYDIGKYLRCNDKKTAVIFGHDKPLFYCEEGQPYTRFHDVGIKDYGGFSSFENIERINFYTDINASDIIRKQLHVIWNFYREHKVPFNVFFHKDNHLHFINNLIYEFKNPLAFHSKKSKSNILSLRDKFILNISPNSDMMKLYKEMVRRLIKELPTELNNRGRFLTRRYYIS